MIKKFSCKINLTIEAEDIEDALINLSDYFKKIQKEIEGEDRIIKSYYCEGIQVNEL